MPFTNLPRRAWLLLAIDALLLSFCVFLAYALRHDFSIPSDYNGWDYATQMKMLAPWIVGTHLLLFWLLKLYRGLIRYAGMTELRTIGIAGILHLILWIAINLAIEQQPGFAGLPLSPDSDTVMRIPYSILLIYSVLALLASAGFRVSRRLWVEGVRNNAAEDLPRTLIVGAGDTGHSLIGVLQRESERSLNIICIVTIYAKRLGMSIAGVPVVALVEKLGEVIAREKIDLVLIALDEQTPERLREVVSACETARVSFRIVPSITNIVGGQVEISKLRAMEIEDLLGREPHELPFAPEKSSLRGERILVTGAGGSIGSELCRQLAQVAPESLILLGKGENSLFDITNEMRASFPALQTETVVGDIRDAARMKQLFDLHRPTVVFHAAAHKHVPLMEAQPDEAVKNNVLGTALLAHLANSSGCKRFILISTDKAVRPTSVMGATKRLAEMVVFSIGANSKTLFHAVRFGNVLGSRGSVIPFFRKQIEAGGPVTVTHPDVTRFFMTVREAVSLVLQAGSFNAPSSSLFLLDMGEPVRIADLARNMIALSGSPADIKIEYTGLRPGEKLREELLTDAEGATKTEIGKLFSTSPRAIPEWATLRGELERLDLLVEEGNREAIVETLRRLVPEYFPMHSPSVGPTTGEVTLRDLDASSDEAVDRAAVASAIATEPAADDLPEGEQEDLFAETHPPTEVADDESDDLPETAPPGDALSDAFADLFGEAAPATEEPPAPAAEAPPAPAVGTVATADEPPSGRGIPIPGFKTEESGEYGAKDFTPDFVLLPESDEDAPIDEPAQESTRGACMLMLVAVGEPDDVITAALHALAEHLGKDDRVLVAGERAPAVSLDGRVEWFAAEGRSLAEAWGEALSRAPDAQSAAILSPRVRLREGALEQLAGAIDGRADAVGVYCDYEKLRPNKDPESVTLLDHQGCIHERFDFGALLFYHLGAVRAVGGIRADLRHAWEYDLQLRLGELGRFVRLPLALYSLELPAETAAVPSALYSPGQGPLGGFSYVFYPADVEAEVTSVFEEALRRRRAWLETPLANVPYREEREPVTCSVVIPVLNRVKYIGNAIRRVLEGTWQDFEIIVIDNGSTDGTQDIVTEIAAADPRVRLLAGTGGSIASALNEGIRAARGRYICQLDSDDQYAPTTLEKMVAAFEADPTCGLAISYYRLMNEAGEVINDVEPITHSGYSRNQILRREGAGALRVFARVVLEEFGLYDEQNYGNFGEDYDMVLKTGEKYNVVRVHEVLYYYRRHDDNTDVTRDPVMKFWNKNHARLEAVRRRKGLVG